MSVIFLAGVHGVGKGYLGSLVSGSLDIQHLTASQLIREEKGLASWRRDKAVTDADDNQSALIRALERKRESERTLLLDGHFVLRASNGDVIRLEQGVFADLKLAGAILLCDAPEKIAERLLLRDGVYTSPDSIEVLAAEEEAHAREVCGALGISLKVLVAPTEVCLAEAIRDLVC